MKQCPLCCEWVPADELAAHIREESEADAEEDEGEGAAAAVWGEGSGGGGAPAAWGEGGGGGGGVAAWGGGASRGAPPQGLHPLPGAEVDSEEEEFFVPLRKVRRARDTT